MRNIHDKLNGGSVARLARYRRALADSLATIRGCRTPEAAAAFIESAGYTSPLNHRYAWMGDAHGLSGAIAAKRERGERIAQVSAPWAMVDAWRDVGDVGDILTLRYTGWYSDADQSELYIGHVWQLPARDGVPCYVAGFVEDQGASLRGSSIDGRRASGYVVLEHDGRGLVTYDDKEDAARAADGLAESAAEDAREYSERWQEASRADSEREEAREALRDARKEARDAIRAARELSAAGVACDAIAQTRAILADKVKAARRDMRRALRDIASAAGRIESLDMTGEF